MPSILCPICEQRGVRTVLVQMLFPPSSGDEDCKVCGNRINFAVMGNNAVITRRVAKPGYPEKGKYVESKKPK